MSGTAREVADRLGVSPAYVSKVRLRWDRDGSAGPRPQRRQRATLLAHLHEALAARLAERPGATVAELCAWIRLEHGVSASAGTVWTTLRGLGLTLKRSRFGPPPPPRRPYGPAVPGQEKQVQYYGGFGLSVAVGAQGLDAR